MTPAVFRERAADFLSSTKLAVALCLVLAAGGVAGSFLYEGNTAVDRPSLFNVFRSPLFLVPAGLLVLNIIFCAGKRLVAMKASAPRTWTFAGIHLGLLLLIAGMAADGLYGFVGTGYFFVGVPSGAHRDWRAGRDATFPFRIEVRGVRVEYHPINLQVGVRDPQGKKLGPFTVREGRSFEAESGTVVVTPRRFDVATKTLAFDALVGGTRYAGVRAGPGGSPPLAGYVVIPVAFHDPEPSDYVAAVRFLRDGAPPVDRVIRINEPARYAGLSFCIVTQGTDPYGNAFVGLQVTREPGEVLFWIGGLLFGLSAAAHFFLSRSARRPRDAGAQVEGGAAAPVPRVPAAVAGILILVASTLGSRGVEATSAGVVIDRDTIWEGEVRVTDPVTVEKGATLTIRPGTKVFLSGEDRDGDGCREGRITVFGSLVVDGDGKTPVRFAPLDPGSPWEEIFLPGAAAVIRGAVFEGARWGLHVHEGDVTVERSLFVRNGGGARTRGTGARFVRCTFRGNGIGLRFWDGGPQVSASVFEENGTGLFYRDGAGGARISGSRMANREWDLKVGDWATGDLDASGNFWRASDGAGAPRRVGDFREDRSGRVVVTPSLAAPPSPCGSDIEEER